MSRFYMLVPIMVEVTCRTCCTKFQVKKLELARGNGRYCSNACKAHHQKINNKPSPTQKHKTQKADQRIAKSEADAANSSFAEYDAICEAEDRVVKKRAKYR